MLNFKTKTDYSNVIKEYDNQKQQTNLANKMKNSYGPPTPGTQWEKEFKAKEYISNNKPQLPKTVGVQNTPQNIDNWVKKNSKSVYITSVQEPETSNIDPYKFNNKNYETLYNNLSKDNKYSANLKRLLQQQLIDVDNMDNMSTEELYNKVAEYKRKMQTLDYGTQKQYIDLLNNTSGMFMKKYEEKTGINYNKQAVNNATDTVKGTLANTGTGIVEGFWNMGNYVGNVLDNRNKQFKKMQQDLHKNNLETFDKVLTDERKERIEGHINSLEEDINNTKGMLTKASEYVLDRVDNVKSNIQEKTSHLSPTSKKIIEYGGAIGNMAPGIAGNVIAPGSGLGTIGFMTSAGGSYLQDAKSRGLTDEKALKYATIMGSIEGTTEQISLGKLGKGISALTKGTLKESIINTGVGVLENAVQEAIIEPVSELTSQTLGGQYDYSNMGKRMLEAGIDGAIVYVLMGGIGAGYKKATNIGQKVLNGEQVSEKEINEAIQEMQDSGVNTNYAFKKYAEKEKAILEQIKSVENSNNTLYNNNRGDINDRGRNRGILEGHDTRLYKNSELQQKKEYTKREYEQFEQSIEPIEQSKLSIEEKNSILNYKNKYNKELIIFENDINSYNGGASIKNANKILINRNAINEFGINRIATHEVLESDIYHNKLIRQIMTPVINDIIKDTNFEKQKQLFWNEQSNELPKDSLIAKDILCDKFAEIENNEALDYNNVLTEETNTKILKAIEDYKKMKGYNIDNVVENSEMSSFSLAKKIENNMSDDNSQESSNNVLEPDEIINNHTRRWEKTIKSNKYFAEGLDIQEMVYEPITNKKILENAKNRIRNEGYEGSINYIKSKFATDSKFTAEDIALIQELMMQSKQIGDYDTALDLYEIGAIVGTESGQLIQALSIIKKMTPEGRLSYLEKQIERLNKLNANKKGYKKLELSKETKQEILRQDTQEGMDQAVDAAMEEIAKQMPATLIEKIDEWRYFAMLANPKTHIKNIASNSAMSILRAEKDFIARTIETALGDKLKTKTKTFKKPTQEVADFVKKNALDMKEDITGSSKYTMKNQLNEKREIFKNKTANKMTKGNSNLLEKEDWLFSRRAYEKALSEYLTANGIKTKADIEKNSKLIKQAQKHAITEARRATFRQASSLAYHLNEIENSSLIGKVAIGGAMPFKKTPINIVKTGARYSPLGLMETLTVETAKLKRGDISANQYIDKVSAGMTGLSMFGIGMLLSSLGVLKGSSSDKEDKYKDDLGETMPYSVKIAGRNFDISALSPASMSVLMGGELMEYLQEKDGISFADIMEVSKKTIDPMAETTMLSSLNDALKSYTNDDTSMGQISSVISNVATSYIKQGVPSIFRRVANVVDSTVRDVKADRTSDFRGLNSLGRQIRNSIPGASKLNEPKTNMWGEEVKRDNNFATRLLNELINPLNTSKSIATNVDKQILQLYDNTQEDDIIPKIPNNYFSHNKQKYELTAEEYTQYKKVYGKYAKDNLNKLFNSSEYSKMSDENKAKKIKQIYESALKEAKNDYLNKKGITEKKNNSKYFN